MNDDNSVPDIVVPEGDVTLLFAVQRLAQAWQIPISSAQAKMGGVLLSGRSLVAYARGQETGREFALRSECWGTKLGLRWFKDGVCEMPDEDGVRITHVSGLNLRESEPAVIFIRETDLQRLIDATPSAHAPDAVVPVQAAPASSEATAEAPAPATPAERKLMAPKEWWFDEARKDHPRRKGESKAAHARRLHEVMATAPVAKQWKTTTILRKMFKDDRPGLPRNSRNLK